METNELKKSKIAMSLLNINLVSLCKSYSLYQTDREFLGNLPYTIPIIILNQNFIIKPECHHKTRMSS